MKRVRKLLTEPAFKYGGYASLITFLAIVAVLVLNVIVRLLGWQIDLTEHQVYSLSEQTRRIVSELDDEVTLYVLAGRNEADPRIMESLGLYDRLSADIRVDTIDADANPGFVSQYDPDGEGLGNGSVVVAGPQRYRVVRGRDLYTVDSRNPQSPQVIGLNVERRITNALLYVATGDSPVVYQTTNRGEVSIQQIGDLHEIVTAENYDTRDLNLLQVPEVPADAGILLMIGPRNDLSQGEAEKIQESRDNGGNLFLMMDISEEPYPVLNELLAAYGVQLGNGVVIETNQRYHTGNQFQLVPDMGKHPVTEPLAEARRPVMIPFAQPIEIMETRPRNIKVAPLLRSSDQSFLRTDMEREETTRLPSDEPGPFPLAVAAADTDFASGEEISRIVVMGNARYLGDVYPYGVIPGNRDFFMNALGWLQNQTESLSIRPKSTLQLPMQLSGLQVLLLGGLFVIVIPLAILVLGTVVWLRRRHL